MPAWVDQILHDPALAPFAPDRRWSGAQREAHVLFLHYRVHTDELRAVVPAPLELQEYDSSAWVATIALRMEDVCLRSIPLPGELGTFSEIDFAALVQYEGRLGFYFLSIEGAHRFSSLATRWATRLPYLYSGATVREEDGRFHATSGPRWVRGRAAASFDATYAPSTSNVIPDPGSPIRMLAGQYSAFVLRRGEVYEMDELHAPWQLDEADVELRENTIPDAAGLNVARTPDLQHYAARRDVVSWLPAPVRKGRPGLAPVEPPGA